MDENAPSSSKPSRKRLSPEAERALAEAAARREAARHAVLPKEIGGREGAEPTRFGDWEKKGIISDF
ncbi:MAG: DUF1674 domain-containing protein [Alphaproteobacteria bacterium]|nr:DUF1674 domain-containing protein [Alphaproteobacteria bacterium]